MIISVDIPEPKFAHGQVIEVKGAESPYHLIVHIIQVESKGSWSLIDGKSRIYSEEIRYTYVHQEGSRDARGGLIRPGTIGVKDQSLEEEGLVIPWDRQTVSPDTLENLIQRKQEWSKFCG